MLTTYVNTVMLQNVDAAVIINREFSKHYNRMFLTFKRVKLRYKAETDLTYFNHPFHETNEMYLLDDYGSDESLSVYSLSSNIENDEFGKKGKKNGMKRQQLKQEDDIDDNYTSFEQYLKDAS